MSQSYKWSKTVNYDSRVSHVDKKIANIKTTERQVQAFFYFSNYENEFRFTVSVLYNIMANHLIGEDYKDRLRNSAKLGRDLQTCKDIFKCKELEAITIDREKANEEKKLN